MATSDENERWISSLIVGGRLSLRASEALDRCCNQDEPWFILAPTGVGGLLAAFSDRLVIIKVGFLTSLMAGSWGGERSTTFFYKDINAIEYNSGWVTGVLEILTASYNGTANRDYWRGTSRSRNANSNDPFVLSNTLPLSKSEYKKSIPQLKQLRTLIACSEDSTRLSQTTEIQSEDAHQRSVADELRSLISLRDSGELSESEFQALRNRIINDC
jgi:hypothetical protein